MVSNISKCNTGNLLELQWLGFLADEKKKLTMKGEKIGENKCGEQWSLDEHSYVEVPKWVVEQVREEERYRLVMTIALTVLISGLIATGVMLVKLY